MLQAQNPAETGMRVAPRPEASLPKGYDYRDGRRKVATAHPSRNAARAALFVLEPPGGGSPPAPPRAALERLVADTIARVRVTLAEVHSAGAEELEQHLRAQVFAALAADAGGPDAAA